MKGFQFWIATFLLLAGVRIAEGSIMTLRVSTEAPGELRTMLHPLSPPLDYKFSYDPQGPCWSHKVDASTIPEPTACGAGFDGGAEATTAYCPNGACKATNWMERAHVSRVPWGCSGTTTPWLPFKVRRCVAAPPSAPLSMAATPKSKRFNISAAVDTGESVEIRGAGTVYCEHTRLVAAHGLRPVNRTQSKSIHYAPRAGSISISISSIMGECIGIEFDSATILLTTSAKIGGVEVQGPSVHLSIRASDLMQKVELILSNIDDDAYLWIGSRDFSYPIICSVRYSGGAVGQRKCDVTALTRAKGVHTVHDFTLRFGNGGGWWSSGIAEIRVNGASVWRGEATRQIRHTGWFYRAVIRIDFIQGQVRVNARTCPLITDCMD